MASLGLWNDLNLLRLAPEGAYLQGGEHGEVLLPLKEVPEGSKVGQTLKVFVYLDSDDYLTASTRTPFAQRGDVALLRITEVNKAGAMLAWGLPHELFLPWKEVKFEQRRQIIKGKKALVIVIEDEDGRIAASTRLDDFLHDEAEGLAEGEKVSLVIGDPTEIGVRVVVNNRFWGMVHKNEIFVTLTKGEKKDGYVKALREDHKLNIALSEPGYAKVDGIAQNFIDVLKSKGGFLAVTDKSQPEEIYALFGISKKVFKQTLGTLYKTRQIVIEEDGIRMTPTNAPINEG